VGAMAGTRDKRGKFGLSGFWQGWEKISGSGCRGVNAWRTVLVLVLCFAACLVGLWCRFMRDYRLWRYFAAGGVI